VLIADAHHTMSDLLTSATVMAALVAVQWGYPILDPIAALIVAVFIGYACWGIFQETSRILADRIVIAADDIRDVVHSVPEVIGCHQIRSRGAVDHVFVDLHVWLDPQMRLDEAHRISHVVKDRIMTRYPQVKDAVIHIEPPPVPR
jgi:cation diffusion facilitator family transporter